MIGTKCADISGIHEGDFCKVYCKENHKLGEEIWECIGDNIWMRIGPEIDCDET